MLRIRLHGRGGQGIKTGGRILGSALFRTGLTVQDAPRYGAERRGAPMVASVRAARGPINERGVIAKPDLVVVADPSLVTEPLAGVLSGVLQGVDSRTVLVVRSAEAAAVWRQRLGVAAQPLALLSADSHPRSALGALCAGAAARLLGVIDRRTLEAAVRDEAATLDNPSALSGAMTAVLAGYDAMEGADARVTEAAEASAGTYEPPRWITLPVEDAALSAPAIHRPTTSPLVRTGLWRTARPVIDLARCRRCLWICGTFCPDNAIAPDRNGDPQIDYDHCKGCLICVAQCLHHAIEVVPENAAAEPRCPP